MTPSLTIVLPIHNGESRLRRCVGEILELASELTPKFSVLIVDDGSSDDTFSAAEELSARYPQISVERNRAQRGLGPTIDRLRRRIRSDVVIVHDGVSPIDPNQVRTLWRQHIHRQIAALGRPTISSTPDAGVLAGVATTHDALAQAHGRLLGFQLVTQPRSDAEIEFPEVDFTPLPAPRTDAAHFGGHKGVGQIPPLPRPKFLAAIAEFALGE